MKRVYDDESSSHTLYMNEPHQTRHMNEPNQKWMIRHDTWMSQIRHEWAKSDMNDKTRHQIRHEWAKSETWMSQIRKSYKTRHQITPSIWRSHIRHDWSSYTLEGVPRPVVHIGLKHPLNIGLDIKRVYDDESCLICRSHPYTLLGGCRSYWRLHSLKRVYDDESCRICLIYTRCRGCICLIHIEGVYIHPSIGVHRGCTTTSRVVFALFI